MIITVSTDALTEVEDHGSILVFTGTTEDGKRQRFGVDHRPASWLIDAVEEEGEVQADVEEWQLLGTAQ